MMKNLLDYGSSSDSDNDDPKNDQKQAQQQQKQPQTIKRKINLNQLAHLKPFKERKIDLKQKDIDSDEEEQKAKKLEQKQKEDSEKGLNMAQKQGIKLFKLSKPKTQLQNIGDKKIQNEKKQIGSKNYEDFLNEKVNDTEALQTLPDMIKIGGTGKKVGEKSTQRVMGKMEGILQNEDLTDQQIKNIQQYDQQDNMFINKEIQNRIDMQNQEGYDFENDENDQEQELNEQDQEFERVRRELAQEREQQQLEDEREILNKNQNKREKAFLEQQNFVELDGNQLVHQDWAGLQEKTATSKELIAKQNIQQPQSKQAKGKNKIQVLAQNVISSDINLIGHGIGSRSGKKNNYGW